MVFDYWYDPTCRESDIPGFLRDFPKDKPLYVLVSHFHKDHFNKVIFKWGESHPDIHYIISRDVARQIRYMLNPESRYAGVKVNPDTVTVLSKMEVYEDSNIDVHCFGSTDIGNSYAVTLKTTGLKVFHAGDLNCWTWRDESTPEEIRAAERAFLSELKPVKEKFTEFDIVMFPVDSRIGTGFNEGAKIFVNTFNVKRFFPMHFTLADNASELEQRRRDAIHFNAFAPDHGEFIGLTEPYDTYSDEDPSQTSAFRMEQARELSESWFLSAGDTNAEQEISLPLLVLRLIDISTTHANNIEVGNPFMPNDHCGWVLSRVSIDMLEYPMVDKTYTIDTWVETWNRHFSERAFCILDSHGKALGYARQIWMVLDTLTRANAGLDKLPFKKEYLSPRQCPIPHQGKHLNLKLPSEIDGKERRVVVADPNPVTYTFQYSDLDAYRHVNTIRYVRLLMNQFTLEEHDAARVRRLELAFLDEGAYGMTIEILRANADVKDEEHPDQKVTDFLLRDKATRNPILFSRVFMEPRNNSTKVGQSAE